VVAIGAFARNEYLHSLLWHVVPLLHAHDMTVFSPFLSTPIGAIMMVTLLLSPFASV
jgi:hypothetical protein